MKAPFVARFVNGDQVNTGIAWGMVLLALLLLCLLTVIFYRHQLPRSELLVVVGLIGIWRYGWKSWHALRAMFYLTEHFPALRTLADAARKPSELLVVVPSYRIDAYVNHRVYHKLFVELAAYGVPSRVVACITDPADQVVVTQAHQQAPGRTQLFFCPQAGRGKRSAMAEALMLLLQQGYADDAQLLLMDGDTLLSDRVFFRLCGFLSRFHDLGAVTCDNEPLIKADGVMLQWYRQRMAMRHFYMSSISLSHRLLVLTGRCSLFRASTLLNREFIHTLEHDVLDHWRYGRLKMLTGDDKSTWFYLLRHRWKMLYIADVKVYCLEEAVSARFFSHSVMLMQRWYGNMLRNNGRALQLGPSHCGGFLWLCLLDQRISIWTTLTGPVFVGLFAVLHSMVIVTAYLAWVIVGRGINCLLVAWVARSFHPLYIPLLWYEQMLGSAVKVYMMFRLDRQRWTRQTIRQAPIMQGFMKTTWPQLMTFASVLCLVTVIALLHGFLQLPS
ncbi:mannuronan synthase [Bacterioplanes sanyensis]|uniref:glycosyltransferase n=1 Tax=Bacterioplanes sanyensis TaxID=1249553 RepID=UPI0016769A9A|nr:glycosyltransferase [Bacterioplanes sanyensis]GGY41490.1 mannuronan synthase [Bacterioplanes sanyensis]